MTITVTFASDLTPYKRFIRKSLTRPGKYDYCIQSDTKEYDCEQGFCDAEDLPDDIRQKADKYNGAHYACEWPLISMVE